MNMSTVETLGNYMSCSTFQIPESDIKSFSSRDTIVSLWNFAENRLEVHEVEYTNYIIKNEAIKKYQNLNICHYLYISIKNNLYSVVSYLKYNCLPNNKVIRHGSKLIDNRNCIVTMKVKE